MKAKEQIRQSLQRGGSQYTKVRITASLSVLKAGTIGMVQTISDNGEMIWVLFKGHDPVRLKTSRFELVNSGVGACL